MLKTLGPSSDMIVIRSNNGGNAIQASTPRWSRRSSRPPK